MTFLATLTTMGCLLWALYDPRHRRAALEAAIFAGFISAAVMLW